MFSIIFKEFLQNLSIIFHFFGYTIFEEGK